MSRNKNAELEKQTASLLRKNELFVNRLKIFKLNSKGQLVFKSLPEKILAKGVIKQDFSHYSLKQCNKVMALTNPVLIDPDSADISKINAMLSHAWSRNFIPTFYGNVEGMTDDFDRYDMRNFTTLSFGVFTGAMPDRSTIDFIFAYFSQSECEHQLDDELEGFRTDLGKSISIVDTLNDMFGVTAGVDYRLVYNLNLKEMPEMQALFAEIYADKADLTPLNDVATKPKLITLDSAENEKDGSQ